MNLKILAAKNTTEQVVENRTWKKNSGPYRIWTHDLCDTGAALYQLRKVQNYTKLKKLVRRAVYVFLWNTGVIMPWLLLLSKSTSNYFYYYPVLNTNAISVIYFNIALSLDRFGWECLICDK